MMRLCLPVPRPARVAVLGIGNELNGDDGAGVRVVRELAARLPATPGVLLIDGGVAPENFTGPLRRFQPDLVIEIDAAHLGETPGTTQVVDWREADGLSASTHTLPPSVLGHYLVSELGCEVRLIGIQPARTDLTFVPTGETPVLPTPTGGTPVLPDPGPLSPTVERAVHQLADALCTWLSARPEPPRTRNEGTRP
jgi:hydrogenase 3 maturation protease